MTEATPAPVPAQETPEAAAETPTVKGFKERMTDWMYDHVGIVKNRAHRVWRENLNFVLDQIPAGTSTEQVQKIQNQFVAQCKSKAAATFMWDATMVGAGVAGTVVLASPWLKKGKIPIGTDAQNNPVHERVFETAGKAAREIWGTRGRNPTVPLQKVYDQMGGLGEAEMQLLRASSNVTVKGADFAMNVVFGIPWRLVQAGVNIWRPKTAWKILTRPDEFQFGRTMAIGKFK